MYVESLEITIMRFHGEIWMNVSGSFKRDQIPGFREKLITLLTDGNRFFVITLEDITFIDEAGVQMFLQILNSIRGKGGTLRFIFKNDLVSKVFQPYQNIISIYTDPSTISDRGFFGAIKRRVKFLFRKTGIRLSRPVALFLLLLLFGWLFTLIYTIHIQNRNISSQHQELEELSLWKERTLLEINFLRERVRPLEQLGIIKDTSHVKNQ
ncbi:MAG: STAS domain-containing protein [Chitinispirillaceae bacterium]|nr:STAS domain-containing protein [Chitinispirillaceae bacterium]